MRIPIRMIGITTTFFWIFLIAFFVSAVYSAKDIRLDFGEPQMNPTTDNKMIFSMPVTIVNNGIYDIGAFNITSKIMDAEGFTVTRGSTFVPVVRRNDAVIVMHNMTMDANDLLQRNQQYLFNDSELTVYQMVGLHLAEVIPVQASTNMSIPWGAPFHNFMLGQPTYAAFNATHFRVTVPVSFENHAFFDVSGTVQTRMYNNADTLLGEGETTIYAPQNSPYNGNAEFYVPISGVTSNGRFEVFLLTPFYNYRPMVVSYG